MPQPIAIHVFDNLIPGMTVNTSLEKLGYQVQRLDSASLLSEKVLEIKPFLLVVDLTTRMGDVNAAIGLIKSNPSLKHIRILAYGDHKNEALLEAARKAGADVVTSNNAVATHLGELVQQALE